MQHQSPQRSGAANDVQAHEHATCTVAPLCDAAEPRCRSRSAHLPGSSCSASCGRDGRLDGSVVRCVLQHAMWVSSEDRVAYGDATSHSTRRRSHGLECTGSHPNSEVKQGSDSLVLRWGTTWESGLTPTIRFCRFSSWSAALGGFLQ